MTLKMLSKFHVKRNKKKTQPKCICLVNHLKTQENECVILYGDLHSTFACNIVPQNLLLHKKYEKMYQKQFSRKQHFSG